MSELDDAIEKAERDLAALRKEAGDRLEAATRDRRTELEREIARAREHSERAEMRERGLAEDLAALKREIASLEAELKKLG